MTKIEAKILRDAALRPTQIKVKNLNVDFEFYSEGAVSKVILSGRRASIPNLFAVLDMIYPRDVSVAVRGLNWYDRNPKTIVKEYNADATGHTVEERISYTVPPDRICLIESITVNAARTVAADVAAGWVNVKWFVTPKGGTKTRIMTRNFLNNTPGDLAAKVEGNLGSGITLFYGDTISMETTDTSTGDGGSKGNVSYECGLKGTEFDV